MVLGASGRNIVTAIARVVTETLLALESVLNLKPNMAECIVQVLVETTGRNVMWTPVKVKIAIDSSIWDVCVLFMRILYFELFCI